MTSTSEPSLANKAEGAEGACGGVARPVEGQSWGVEGTTGNSLGRGWRCRCPSGKSQLVGDGSHRGSRSQLSCGGSVGP